MFLFKRRSGSRRFAKHGAASAIDPMPLINPIRKFVVFTNAKCGGTSIKYWFMKSLALDETARNSQSIRRNFGADFAAAWDKEIKPIMDRGDLERRDDASAIRAFVAAYRRLYCAEHLDLLKRSDFFKFAVVRDPYQRAVSSFVDKFCTSEVEKTWSKKVVETAGTNGEINFLQFLEYVGREEDSLLNAHWRPQCYLLRDFEIDKYIRLEALNDGMVGVEKTLGMETVFDAEVKMQSNTYSNSVGEVGDPCDATANVRLREFGERHGGFPDKGKFLTPRAVDLINEAYAEDFSRLPYDLDRSSFE